MILRDCHEVRSDDNPVSGGRPNQEVESLQVKTETHYEDVWSQWRRISSQDETEENPYMFL